MESPRVGNDVVDLSVPARREHFSGSDEDGDRRFFERHLEIDEREELASVPAGERFLWFWRTFAAKEAAYKAFAQAGIDTPRGGYSLLRIDSERSRVVHAPSGREAEMEVLAVDGDLVHAIALVERGHRATGERNGKVLSAVGSVPPGREASDFARDLAVSCLDANLASGYGRYAITSENGIPRVLEAGHLRPWSVSLSHSGRFAAASVFVP